MEVQKQEPKLGVLDLLREAVKNVPALKYTWGVIASICVLAILSYFRLDNTTVPVKSILIVIALSAVVFLFSFIVKGVNDKFIRFAIYLVIYSLVITLAVFIVGFGMYIFTSKPTFYENIFNTDEAKNNNILLNSANKFNAVYSKISNVLDKTGKSKMPQEIIAERNDFEKYWLNSNNSSKEKISDSLIFLSISNAIVLHRIEEEDNIEKINSLNWADEQIKYFEAISDKKFLTEALIIKANIFFDQSQMNNKDLSSVKMYSSNGDKVMNRAFALGNLNQKGKILRIWSKFYYNLARPEDGDLSKDWNDTYLQVSLDKIVEAYNLDSLELKNSTQMSRTICRIGKNYPNYKSKVWAKKMRSQLEIYKVLWASKSADIQSPKDRLAPLNILSVLTLEVISSEWLLYTEFEKRSFQRNKIQELEKFAIKPQIELISMVKNTSLSNSYEFDIYFDLSKMNCLKAAINNYNKFDIETSTIALINAKNNLKKSIENANNQQRIAAKHEIRDKLPCILLNKKHRSALLSII